MLNELLLWNKVGGIVTELSHRLNISGRRALDIWYRSRTNMQLHDPETGLYLFGDKYIADNVIRELQDL